jgi:hypothetical protein
VGSKRAWRDVPREERGRIIALVYRGGTPADPRDAANAAAYAQWMLDRDPPRPFWIIELLYAPLAVAISVYLYLASVHAGGILAIALLASLHGFSLYQRSRRSKRLAAARESNAALATDLGGVEDVEFPARDPNEPSPWKIRRGFALVVGTVFVLLPALIIVGSWAFGPS